MNQLGSYEKQALEEILKWRDEGPDVVTQALETTFKPLGWILGQVVPEKAQQTLEAAVLGALELLKVISFQTYSEKAILKEARELGLHVKRPTDLANYDLRRLDALARKQFASNRLMAALEGAGCGAGGLALVAADIPILFGLALRAIQQIGTCYGFDMRDPQVWPVILQALNAGSSTAAKASVLADMTIAAKALAKNWTYKKVSQKTGTGMAVMVLKDTAKSLPREIARWVTKRKLAQLIPLAGAAIGAGFNYWFLGEVCTSAYMIFRHTYIEAGGHPPASAVQIP